MYQSYRDGWVETISGCMFAGKTEELIRRIKVLEFAKKEIVVFKPKIDNRYSDTKVASHAGSQVESIVIEDATSLSETGYQGRKVTDMLEDLFLAAKGDKELAQKGILVIDEFDKLGKGFKAIG